MGSGAPDVRLTGVTKRFGDDIVAVDRVDLDVRNGEFLALLGPSGCGKTTTLRLIAGFEEPTDGEIEIGGRSAVAIPPHRRDVNTVFQQYALFPHMTVLDNVAYGLKQRKVAKAERRTRDAEALELVRLTGRETAKPAELSGGMQQRVALARALVLHPKVLLLDEPLGAHAKKLRDAMQIDLKRNQRDVGIPFIVVTHDQEEAMAMADRIAVMNDGRIDQLGAPSQVYDRPATPFVADFIGDMNQLEGTLQRDAERLVCDVDGLRFGIGLVVREAEVGQRVRIGLRPEGLHASMGGDGAPAVAQTAMVLGHQLQVVAQLEGGTEVMARQPRAGGDGMVAFAPGDRVRLRWSPTAALLLGPAEGTPTTETREPLELPA